MDESLAYLGALATVGILATIGMLYLTLKEQSQTGRKSKKGRGSAARASRRPRVQVIWEGDELPLIWVVDGRGYSHPDNITSVEQRQELNLFLEKIHPFVAALEEEANGVAVPEEPSSKKSATEEPEPGSLETPATSDSSGEPHEAEETEIDAPSTDDGTEEAGAEVEAEAPSAEPEEDPSQDLEAETVPPGPLSYEESLQLPLVERIKASFFGSSFQEEKPSESLNRLSSPAIPRLEDLDALLQKRLQSLEDAPPASIRAGEDGLLEIVVDGTVYERIDDVPQEEMRNIMREAVQSWEKRFTV